ncbi:MAG TPA: hypothetical protein VFC55_00935, partial [Desulfobaccales bacterium]|nr:hypothetical protein [Desulfobaccales bacterium]
RAGGANHAGFRKIKSSGSDFVKAWATSLSGTFLVFGVLSAKFRFWVLEQATIFILVSQGG